MAESRFFPLAASQQNLRRLLFVRLIVFACQVMALAYAWGVLGLVLGYSEIMLVFAVIVAVNAGVIVRMQKQLPVSDRAFLGHLLFDVLSLAVLLYFSGGATNPFVSFFLVPITISAAILPWTHTWVVAGISLLSYSLLLFVYQPLSALTPMTMADGQEHNPLSLHILGMWFNFLASAALITYFVVKMASEIRDQEHRLNRYREENLRDEQILAVATQAAGTAHELGTPLNTMALLVDEMADDYGDDPALQKDLATLSRQLDTCKQALKGLVSRASLKEGGTARPVTVDKLITQITEQWSLLRPEVTLAVRRRTFDKAPLILVDATLQQAIVNILNNAADASPQKVDVEVSWSDREWRLVIHDYGTGIKEDVLSALGSAIVSGKEEGMGVGVMLSQASIGRLGGSLHIRPAEGQGTITEIVLPLYTAGELS